MSLLIGYLLFIHFASILEGNFGKIGSLYRDTVKKFNQSGFSDFPKIFIVLSSTASQRILGQQNKSFCSTDGCSRNFDHYSFFQTEDKTSGAICFPLKPSQRRPPNGTLIRLWEMHCFIPSQLLLSLIKSINYKIINCGQSQVNYLRTCNSAGSFVLEGSVEHY